MVQVPLKDYSYANARVRAMYARLLDDSVYKELLDALDYNQAIAVLENTEYGEDIEHFMMEGARPTTIDRAFNRNLVRNFDHIKEFFMGRPEDLVNALLSRWDLYNLKTILRGMRALIPKTEITRNLIPIGSIDQVTLEEIINQPDLRASIDAIVMFSHDWWIPYGQALTAHLGEFLREHDLTILELALDIFHYEKVSELLKRQDQDTSLVHEVVRMEIDSINIVTLMRICGLELKESSAEDYFIPGGGIATAKDFARIMALGQPEDVYEALLKRTPYRKTLEKAWANFDERGESAFEDEMEKHMISACLKMSKDPLGIGVIIEYMWKKFLEITNLRIIIRGKSIGLIESQIRKELFMRGEEARQG
ncbi:MAG: V-type ATPase subunit [Actinobacteria bacterium]|nr:V-type ATPase subunit [Actinomycetota bacterium]